MFKLIHENRVTDGINSGFSYKYVVSFGKKRKKLFRFHLKKLFDDISTEDVVENSLKELVRDYRQLEFVPVPQEDSRLLHCSH